MVDEGLDEVHLGDIQGAVGTIRVEGEGGAPTGVSARSKTLLAIVGPGLIVMVGDTDAATTAPGRQRHRPVPHPGHHAGPPRRSGSYT